MFPAAITAGNLFMKYKYMIIEGNIGAGKTTLAEMLAATYNARLVLEQFADNPFLPSFYKDPERYAFALELSFLAERYQQLKRETEQHDLFHELTVSDYYFMKCLIFARQNLQGEEYRLYRQMFDFLLPSIPRPDLYVYLHLPIEKLKENIKKRGRSYEQSITSEYLRKIQDGYFDFFSKNDNLPILIIDTQRIDFSGHEADYQMIVDVIFNQSYPVGLNRIML
jgi:deoxyguanosine kinase